MRLLPILCLLILFAACKPRPREHQQVAVSEDTTFLTGTFYLVRHAERNPGPDSTLTAAGMRRAGALYQLLKDSGLNKIYLTHYTRSIQTADSLRLRLHLDTCFYRADTSGESLIYEITRHGDWGKRILVIGHSNTLAPIMRSLRAKPPVNPVGEDEYDRLFIIRKNAAGTSLKESCY
ncbi:histidine phosphatase family protein [Chitinophaga sp. MM2321]|uniref:histidine phosphatase family protein n=1 Tax=Chitinophaga sp. MM2321 TaxID=3137178 RepID=UPI0032D5AA18